MIFGSVCSGIGAAELAWSSLGWSCAWSAEIDAFPSRVLAHRFPGVPNLGDFTKIGSDVGAVDVLVGGTPCQSFSSAGGRAGLDDPRGNLAIEFVRLARRVRARWLVWENVPGVLSTNRGRDFGAFLGAMEDGGYGWAYRIVDAHGFGLPQRRRRLFVIGRSRGSFQRAAVVLLEPACLRGDPDPRGAARSEATAEARASASAGLNPSDALIASDGLSPTLTTRGNRCNAEQDPIVVVPIQEAQSGASQRQGGAGIGCADDPMFTLLASSVDHAIAFHAIASAPSGSDIAPTLTGGACVGVMSFDETQITHRENRAKVEPGAPAPALCQASRVDVIGADLSPRRLTPREWERLQGFPDDWTLIELAPAKGKRAARWAKDTHRYKAIGNSMAVPVMRWIGERIELVDKIEDRP